LAAARREQRSLYAYSIHGRDEEGIIDYTRLLDFFERIPSANRQTSVGDEMVAITAILNTGSARALRFVAGREGIPLFYNVETGEEVYEDLGPRMVANASWCIMDPETRFVVVERRRPGVGVNVMARAMSLLGRELGFAQRLTVDLNPVASSSLAVEIERFSRIRQAAVVVARPNLNWDDSAAFFTEYASESNADAAEVLLTAGRGRSLSKDSGIVSDIKELLRNRVGPLKNLRIVGRRQGETRDTGVSLERHQEKRFVELPAAGQASPIVEREAVLAEGRRFLDELTE
jgi:hypothetical protein